MRERQTVNTQALPRRNKLANGLYSDSKCIEKEERQESYAWEGHSKRRRSQRLRTRGVDKCATTMREQQPISAKALLRRKQLPSVQ